ncbi:breast cancer type 1 susceptibility protein homolog isoform X2 [Xyrauchen texanus]|uniref:breast cancer type 1 susceptibility protein homolog isoform X2 n=1 Tax=Xyrauchen texanus TaxID=154827 RepID=UPI0022421B3B|nr:breast cancer type 1 susceptibility protein homolog isoform X2 [Xyrauchen texanus]
MSSPHADVVRHGISVIWENLQCPICLDLMVTPVSTKCDHQFCKFCMLKLLDRSKRNEASCPVCKMKITKRTLHESPGFQTLVEGLKYLVQSYEFDTCTNYFTGMLQKRQQECIETGSGDQHCILENIHSSDMEIPYDNDVSLSSSAAAKDGFAQLMDLENSCPSNSEEKEADMSKLPQNGSEHCISTLERKKEAPGRAEQVVYRRKTRSHAVKSHESESQDAKNPYLRHSNRTSNKSDSKQEGPVDHKQKMSVDKVSEWLLNTSPTINLETKENSSVRNKNIPGVYSDSDNESICSSVTSVNNQPACLELVVRPALEGSRQRLEEQVFGAIYKRGRKTSKDKHNKRFSPEKSTAPHTSCFEEVESNLKMSGDLTPANVLRNEEETAGSYQMDVEEPEELTNTELGDKTVKDVKLNSCKAGQLVINSQAENKDGIIECLEEEHENRNVENSPVFEIPLTRPRRKLVSKMEDAFEGLNNNGNKNDKQVCKRKNRCENLKDYPAQSKNARKSLTLVNAGTEIAVVAENSARNAKMVETEVHIETFPSSEEPQTPDKRLTRRSLRLQLFTEQVQGTCRKKKPKQVPKDSSLISENILAKTSNLDNTECLDTNVTRADTEEANVSSTPKSKKSELVVGKNGCVYNSDLSVIEKLQSSSGSFVQSGQPSEEKSYITAVPNTIVQDEQSVSMVSYISPSVAVIPLLENHNLDSSNVVSLRGNTLASSAALCAAQSKGIEIDKEHDASDSEQDTEQLMRTFKTTKRKSFYLHSPKATLPVKAANSLRNGPNNTDSTDKPNKISMNGAKERSDTPSALKDSFVNDDVSTSNHVEPLPPEALPQKSSDNANSTCVIKSPGKTTAYIECQEQTSIQNSAISESLCRVSNSQNSRLPEHSEPMDSALLFPVLNATEDEPQKQSCKASEEKQSPKIASCDPWTQEHSKENQGHIAQSDVASFRIQDLCHSSGNMPNSCRHSLDSSITPDGLIAGETIRPVVSESLQKVEESSVESVSLPNIKRKKRRAQRLDSSDSELSNDEGSLPSMSQIFKCHPLDPNSSKGSLPRSADSNQDGTQVNDQRANSGPGSSSQHSHSMNRPESGSGYQDACPPQRQMNVTGSLVTIQDDCTPVLPNKDDCLPSSQGSVDLFGTPEECAVDGISGDARLSVESSQYEIFNTQKKVEMQEELRRLERMMALVSEALRKKESDCGSKGDDPSPSQAPQLDQNLAGTECMKNVWKGERTDSDNKAPDSSRDHPDIPETVQSNAVNGNAQAIKGRYFTRGSQQSLGNRRLSSQRLSLRSCVKAQSFTADQTTKPTDEAIQRKALPAHPKTKATDSGASCRVTGLVASGLTASELSIVKKFAKKMGCSLTKEITSNTTHIIIKTDENLVCERTLKYFQGIAGRKWVLSFQWVSECFRQGKILDEALFEVYGDVVNGHNHNGPLKARTTSDDNLLMRGYEICFHGCFTHMSRGQMEVMVEMCGAAVVTDPLMFSTPGNCQLVVVQPSPDDDVECYRALQQKAVVVSRGWLLDSIATYTLQNPEHYRP